MAVKKSTKTRERRRSARVDAKLSMRVEGTHDGGDAKIVTETLNISNSGVYARSTHYLPPLSKVLITVVLPKIPQVTRRQQLIKCDGIVVRCELHTDKRTSHPYDLACMFTALDAERRDLLEAFVTWRNLQALRAAVSPPSARRAPAARKNAAARPARKKTAIRSAKPKRASAASRTRTGARRTAR